MATNFRFWSQSNQIIWIQIYKFANANHILSEKFEKKTISQNVVNYKTKMKTNGI